MSIAYIDEQRSLSAAARPLLLLLNLSLGGCVTTNHGSPMDARAEVPVPPTAHTYLPVEDLPPNRPTMTIDELVKLKKELNDARDRQGAAAKAKNGPAQPESAKPQ